MSCDSDGRLNLLIDNAINNALLDGRIQAPLNDCFGNLLKHNAGVVTCSDLASQLDTLYKLVIDAKGAQRDTYIIAGEVAEGYLNLTRNDDRVIKVYLGNLATLLEPKDNIEIVKYALENSEVINQKFVDLIRDQANTYVVSAKVEYGILTLTRNDDEVITADLTETEYVPSIIYTVSSAQGFGSYQRIGYLYHQNDNRPEDANVPIVECIEGKDIVVGFGFAHKSTRHSIPIRSKHGAVAAYAQNKQ